jgi:hypothetical protein
VATTAIRDHAMTLVMEDTATDRRLKLFIVMTS